MKHLLVLAFACAAAASTARAQVVLVHDINQPLSNFAWTGTSTLGNIVGDPSNTFQLQGTVTIDAAFQPGADPYSSASFVSGVAAAVPDLRGRINNPIPGFPPLARIQVNGLVLSPSSPSFTVAPGGGFTASVTLTALSGTLVVDPLSGSTTTTDLTGLASSPTSATGTFVDSSSMLRLSMPVSSAFPFSDPGTGASGTITVTGTLVADRLLVRAFCAGDGTGTACPCANHAPAGSQRGCLNSTGVGALLTAVGDAKVSADTFRLDGTGMPGNASALYFQGTTEASGGAGVVFGDGKRCAAGTVIRLGTKANVGGSSSYPAPGDPTISVRGAVPAGGAVRTYQVWYRNAAAFCTADTFNLTGGLRVTWLP